MLNFSSGINGKVQGLRGNKVKIPAHAQVILDKQLKIEGFETPFAVLSARKTYG
jgi:hypothetical protein